MTIDDPSDAIQSEVDAAVEKLLVSSVAPHEKPGRPDIVTLSGEPKDENYVPSWRAPHPLDETGMYKDYWILSDEERKKGFVRPVRQIYIHNVCKTRTTCNIKLAETYAVNPHFYSGTFCYHCSKHFPVAEFNWINSNGTVGEVVGT